MISTEKVRRKQLGILWEITILLTIVFIAYGLLTYFVFRASENRLINKSIDKLKQTEAENISSSYDYLMKMYIPEFTSGSAAQDLKDVVQSLATRQPARVQLYINEELQKMVDSGLLGLSDNIFIFEDFPGMDEPFVFASSDGSLVWKWEVPDYINQVINGGGDYIWMDDGIPELGLQGEYLIVIETLQLPTYGLNAGLVGIKPMHEEIAAINDFYSQDKRTTNLILLLLVIGSIVVIALITFLFLSYLIRTRITEPIEELSVAAGKVMEGDFDVHITIRAGEEFEQLKRAFQSMVEEWVKLMGRSLEEGD
jgi:nitrogen fixation/metabolism regulation signal transduction histidine kinase